MAPFYINYFVSGEAVRVWGLSQETCGPSNLWRISIFIFLFQVKLSSLGICPRRLVDLTTDGASTMVATGRELNFLLHQLCLGNFVGVGTCGCKGNGEGFRVTGTFYIRCSTWLNLQHNGDGRQIKDN
jgi:hypothetical protein